MRIMMSRLIRRYTTTILVICVFSTMALVMMLSHTHGDGEMRAIQGRRLEIVDQYRTRKLHELQSTLFVKPVRPPDETYNINVTLAESIPLDREIPDTRPESCSNIKYDYSKLPHISVIIPFYNEALSMLLRTVHSILKRTPPELLSEIIMVNDNSPNDDLQEPLETYVRYLPSKVKLIRTKEREGLIRARLIGARMAKGPVIMFQDAHTEANTGWAEPLLEEIRKNPRTIVQPEVDQIEAMSLEYIGSSGVVPRGGFSWDLRYTWMQMPEHEKKRINYSDNSPFRSPTLVGCAFAVLKKHFFEIGGFDDAMNIWGGENIELAFRNWMCHGQVLTHTCSRVAHTFKPFAYKFDGDREKIVQKNLMRIAELWMDDYKRYFFAATYNWEVKRTYFTEKDWETLEQRKKLKKDMKCKSFEWYMKSIVPEIPRPFDDAVYYGEVFSEKTEACWYISDDNYMAMTYFCFFHRVLPENIFYIDNRQRLKFKNQCSRVDPATWLLKLEDCPDHDIPEKWDVIHYREIAGWTRVTLHKDDGKKEELCVTQVTNINTVHYKEQMPQLMACDFSNEFQHWRWTYKFDFNYNFDKPVL